MVIMVLRILNICVLVNNKEFCVLHIQSSTTIVVLDCTCNTQNSLLLNQHNGDDALQDMCPGFLCCACFLISLHLWLFLWFSIYGLVQVLFLSQIVNFLKPFINFLNSHFPVTTWD